MPDVNYTQDNFAPPEMSLRVQQYLEVFDEIYHDNADSVMTIVQNIFNTQFNLPEEVNYMLFALFGFIKPDLSFFSDAERETIANNYADNIFILNRDKLKIDIFKHILYIYMIQGNVYPLITYNFIDYIRRNPNWNEELKLTDIGLTTDMAEYTDNLYNTPFVEIEIILSKEYAGNELWFGDIDILIKKEMDLRKYLLTKIFYSLNCPCNGEVNHTITNANGVVVTAGNITSLYQVENYMIMYNDSSTSIFPINTEKITEDTNNYYYYIETSFNENRYIIGITLLDVNNVELVSITTPTIFLASGDNMIFNVIIAKV
jgi:hypothetical protein